jgi:hypothetical protein
LSSIVKKGQAYQMEPYGMAQPSMSRFIEGTSRTATEGQIKQLRLIAPHATNLATPFKDDVGCGLCS